MLLGFGPELIRGRSQIAEGSCVEYKGNGDCLSMFVLRVVLEAEGLILGITCPFKNV